MSVARAMAGLEAAVGQEHDAVASALAEGLERVSERLEQQLSSELPPVRELCEHLERYRGKMLRPMMTLLAGLAVRGPEASGSDITDAHVTVGAVVEIIHLATLVHDDVLDEAETRRRGLTINRLRGNEAAVILGDYLISSAFHLCSRLDSQATAILIGGVTTRLCEGELLQLHHREDYSLDEATYFEIVERKTAELIGAACDLGAAFAGASDATRRRLREYGVKLGVAFQIQDDLLDLTGDERVVGKPVGKDLEKGKLTLPLIHHLATVGPVERGRMLRNLEDGGWREAGGVLKSLDESGSLVYTRETARRLVAEAKALLEGAIEDSPAAALMRALADAVVARSF